MYDGNILHCKECLGLSDVLFCVQGRMFVYFDWNVWDTLCVTPCVWRCPVYLSFIFCCIWDWLIYSLRVFIYAGNRVDVCWQLPLVGMGRTLLSRFQLLFSMQSPLWPLTGSAMQNAWAACVKCNCVCVWCLQLKLGQWDSSLCGWAVALSLPRSVSAVCLSLWGCWRWQKWNALPVLWVKLPCCWFSCAIRTVKRHAPIETGSLSYT